ncbi:hypothetical protein GGR52DRAFT_189270 [Hypoxylon sp. FL1284]|nr:hypothetical protein GGR52DRAFT_189270 [Hypoxylon sp. FL1284]
MDTTTRNGKVCTRVPKVSKLQRQLANPSADTSSSTPSTSTSTSTSTSSSTSAQSLPTDTDSSSAGQIGNAPSPSPPPEDPPPQPPPSPTPPAPPPSTTTATPGGDTTTADNPDPPEAATTTDSTSADSATKTSLTDSATESSSQSDSQTQNSDTQTDDAATQSQVGQPTDSSTSVTPVGDARSFATGGSQSTSSALGSETSGAGLSGGTTAAAVTGNGIGTKQTIAIAAGVVGGVVVISLLAFLIWLWRKRKARERRGTLSRPLTPDVMFRDGEKHAYSINRLSIGPTPFHEKIMAITGTKYKRIRGRFNNILDRSDSPSPSVNLDRGNSQFGPPAMAHSRDNSKTGGAFAGRGASPTRSRFVDWWGRLVDDGNFSWRLQHESAVPRPLDVASPSKAGGSPPDFLTLLNMDDNELEREAAARRRSGGAAGNQRRSVSVGGEQHFLGGLNLDFGDPFSDANAAAAPVGRARGLSVGVNNNNVSRQPSTAGTASYYYRESNVSVSTMGGGGTRRTRFRSDPFDLDRPDLLQSASSSTAALAGGSSRDSLTTSNRSSNSAGLPNTPRPAHVRDESLSSKYSSGVSSLGQWSDPGPDVGPAAARFTPSPDSALGRRDSHVRVESGGSQRSVGKAV